MSLETGGGMCQGVKILAETCHGIDVDCRGWFGMVLVLERERVGGWEFCASCVLCKDVWGGQE